MNRTEVLRAVLGVFIGAAAYGLGAPPWAAFLGGLLWIQITRIGDPR